MKKPKIRVKNETSFDTMLARRIARAVWDDREIGLPLVVELKLWTSKKQMPRVRAYHDTEAGMSSDPRVNARMNVSVLRIVFYGRDDGVPNGGARTLLHHLAWQAVWIHVCERQRADRAVVMKLAHLTGQSNAAPPSPGIRRNDVDLMVNACMTRVSAKLGLVNPTPSSGPGQQEVPVEEFITNAIDTEGTEP